MTIQEIDNLRSRDYITDKEMYMMKADYYRSLRDELLKTLEEEYLNEDI